MSRSKDGEALTGRELAREAYRLSGCKTHREFLAIFDGAIKPRTFADWVGGTSNVAPLAQLMLREFIAGWRPRTTKGGSS